MKYTLDPGETPPYAFCESVHAGALAPWHIRRVTPAVGLKIGGGIDTPSLCGMVKAAQGWDLNVRIRMNLLTPAADGSTFICLACASLYITACKAEGIEIVMD
jgi:hypothetical protein